MTAKLFRALSGMYIINVLHINEVFCPNKFGQISYRDACFTGENIVFNKLKCPQKGGVFTDLERHLMNDLKFTNIAEENRSAFHSLMRTYAKELDEHQHRNTDPDILTRWTDRIIEKQHEASRCLKLCYSGGKLIGFLYAKIDSADDRGHKQIGFGCIMEFYIVPEQRRKGFGRDMLLYLEDFFRKNGVTQLYLTADPVTGKPFWTAMGFTATGENSPDNGQEIYEKSCPIDFSTQNAPLV